MRRVAVIVGVVAAGALLLTSCSPAPRWGVRLNGDGTVDYVICGRGGFSVDVDYVLPTRDDGVVEWFVPGVEEVDLADRVIRYGHVPPGLVADDPALAPPDGWDHVEFGTGSAERDDLAVGEWIWQNSDAPWVPGHPCVPVDDAGDPVDLEGA